MTVQLFSRSARLDDAYSIAIGTGYRQSGSWNVLPTPVFDRFHAETIAGVLFHQLTSHAAEEDRRRAERHG